ncbi:phospholipase D-like domain-containing protein [Clostridium guangxiense]|uniref:phospholipase D-like domain-containing protein n=1 Tax=Clostridium guangxiense TaxID=1662055 RepID=UPI001E2C383F|nr:phospholipase D-like domain-containing protein [Clostridium guangxiense]MCD2348876.1 phospholipase D-like domain-containing protein [Clostridium guangxiense]
MVRDGVFCENQKSIVTELLSTATKSVKIAVAWINFDDYREIFILLLQKKIKIRIAVNDDVANRKYSKNIKELTHLGAKIRFISMPSNNKYEHHYMHHKFCIIDNKLCISGSFNWTKNANDNNYENLIVSHDINLVNPYILEFKAVWQLSKDDINMLRNPECCEYCKKPKMIICIFSQEGYYNTQADLYKVCGCDIEHIFSDYFDISVYNNLITIFEKYSDMDEYAYEHGYDYNKEDRNEKINFDISNYLSNIRANRMNYKCQD